MNPYRDFMIQQMEKQAAPRWKKMLPFLSGGSVARLQAANLKPAAPMLSVPELRSKGVYLHSKAYPGVVGRTTDRSGQRLPGGATQLLYTQERARTPVRVYHGTTSDRAERIMREGFQPDKMERSSSPLGMGLTYFAEAEHPLGRGVATSFARGKAMKDSLRGNTKHPVLLEAEVPWRNLRFNRKQVELMSAGAIGPEHIKAVHAV